MKKSIITLLGGLTLLSFVGCGNKTTTVVTQQATSTTPQATSTQTPEVQTLTLKVAHCNAEDHPFGAGAIAFKEKVEQLSGGNITVDLYHGTMSTEEKELMAKMQAGEASMVVITPNLISNVPEIDVFSLEYLFDNFNHWATCLDANFGMELADIIKQKTNNQFQILGYWSAGIRDYYGKKPITKPQDLEGTTIRISSSPVQQEFWKACGATHKSVGWGDLYNALNNNEVDGAENDYTSMMLKEHHKTPNGHYICETEHDFTTRFFVMDGNVFDSYTAEQQDQIMQAAEYATNIERQRTFEQASSSKAQVIADGAEVTESDAIDQEAFRAIAYPIQDNYAKEHGMERFIQMVRDMK